MKYSTQFYPQRRKDKATGELPDKNLPVQMSVTWEGKRLTHYTGVRTDPERWDKDQRRIIGTDRKTRQMNKTLTELEEKVEKVFLDASLNEENSTVTFGMLKAGITKKQQRTHTLLKAFEIYLADLEIRSGASKGEGSQANGGVATVPLTLYKKFKTTFRHVNEYLGRRKDVEFGDIDRKWMQGFHSFLLNEKQHVNNTAAKYVKALKALIKWAADEGMHKNTKYKLFAISEDEVPVITLNWDQVMKLYNADLKEDHLKRVRDVFLFQVATALRYSDVKRLKRADIKDGVIRLMTRKGRRSTAIPLNFLSREILERYDGFPLDDDLALPVISNQKMNNHLKDVGRIAGLKEPVTITRYRGEEEVRIGPMPLYECLTTHVGRKSFVSIAFYLGMPKELIMAITTHTNAATLEKHYLSIMPEHIKAEMERVFRKV
ncbi:MAG TPA: site-specific integrase [Bacteroidales bacterium]|nr:site-specific integrase [Bacteroidales bacterium]